MNIQSFKSPLESFWKYIPIGEMGPFFPFLLSTWDWGSSNVKGKERKKNPLCTCFIPTHPFSSFSLPCSFSGFPAFDAINHTTSSEQIWGTSVLCRNTKALIFLLFIFAAFAQDSEESPLWAAMKGIMLVLLPPLASVQHWLSSWVVCQALRKHHYPRVRLPRAGLHRLSRLNDLGSRAL